MDANLCLECGKPLTDKRALRCLGECKRKAARAYNKKWKDKQPKGYNTSTSRAWEQKTGPRSACRHYRKRYGLTYDEVVALYEGQGYRCKVCLAEVRLGGPREGSGVVDHNHATGKIRGILCVPCNLMIGYAKDDPAILADAIQYLQEVD